MKSLEKRSLSYGAAAKAGDLAVELVRLDVRQSKLVFHLGFACGA